MKTIFDKTTRDQLIGRINGISETAEAQWGKMSVYQMLKHCTQWEEMMLGRKKYKRAFLGRLFGKMALNNLIKDENPMKPNLPTLPEFKIVGTGDVAAEREKWIILIDEHARSEHINFVHPFFGKLTKEQTGYLAYKHIDHHLRQFNS
jgi:Protein of unknown function (DUF1569)